MKNINPDKEILSVIKFSPSSDVIAIGYAPPISSVHLFSIKNNKV